MTDRQRPSTRRYLEVWRLYLVSQNLVLKKLEREMQAAHGLSLAEFDVLAHVSAAPDQRLRLGQLAEAVLFTTGGITRLLDRLCDAGLLVRERDPADRRVVYAVLTSKGNDHFQQASRSQLRGVVKHFGRQLTADDIDAVEAFLTRLVDSNLDPA
ncbi:MarR family transcriptional regulator [Micromonospora phytophila]|uniref:MarR family winged helix-turn-helix transcriptional regulator n=1 Tax=Micromonospora phytophila TaxID=709888 RepID=UPI00202F9E18|nr:MarR family transcriptional regulator [Micromonospora phytophila]MCM0673390.1 MarR family transcriptional regulator [Micromonospora phytophila]